MKRPDPAAARSKLIAFLYGCTTPVLATANVRDLAIRYQIDAKTAEYELVVARQKRAGEAA